MRGSFVYLVFTCAALVWTWVLPIWQGPDESAHFSYVQYMIVHNRPPKVAIVQPGYDPWAYGASKSAMWSKVLTERNWVLTHPDHYLKIYPSQRYDVLERLHTLSTFDTNVPSGQNYVGIYPPFYYGVIAKLIRWVGIQIINHQAYQMHLMLVQIASGIDYPWWRRPVTWGPFYALWGAIVASVLCTGGGLLFRRDKVLFVVTMLWTIFLASFLWYTEHHYLLETGSNFIQGRYFFAILPVFVYTAGLALRRRWQATCLLVFAAVVYLTVVEATVYRYYHSTLWHMFIGHVVTYDPATITVGGQLALMTLLFIILRYVLRPLTISFRRCRGRTNLLP